MSNFGERFAITIAKPLETQREGRYGASMRSITMAEHPGKLQLSMGSDDKVTELVGEKIIELAMAGERNADRLTARVLAEFGIGNDGSLWPH